MCKVLLSFIMLFNSINYVNEDKTIIEKIDYFTNYQNNDKVRLDISVDASFRDIVELKIYFCDENKNKLRDKYYSSALEIKGQENTIANIPITIKEKVFFNIVAYSSNLDKEILNIVFPIYPKEYLDCNLNENKICKGNYPSIVTYENETIVEKYENIGLINDDLEFNEFNNIVPFSKINLVTNLKVIEGYGYAFIEQKIENFNLDYNNGYKINLLLIQKENIIQIKPMDKYYIDFIEGITSQNYLNNSIYSNDLLLPYTDGRYEFEIYLIDYFMNFSHVKLKFTVDTKYKLIGRCEESKYCIRRNYL